MTLVSMRTVAKGNTHTFRYRVFCFYKKLRQNKKLEVSKYLFISLHLFMQ